jgi:WD40 repeat protein
MYNTLEAFINNGHCMVQTQQRISPVTLPQLTRLARVKTSHAPQHLSLSADGQLLAASLKKQLMIYRTDDSGTQALQQVTQIDDFRVWMSCFQPDGNWLAFSGGILDGTVRFWHTDTGQVAGAIGQTIRPVLGLDFHPDGDVLAGAGWGGLIWLWDTTTGETITTNESHETLIRTLAFSPDGQFIASAGGIFDGNVRIWYVENKQRLHLFDAYTHLSGKLLYSPDSQFFVSAGRDRIIHVWNAQDGQEHVSLYGHADEVQDIAFSPDSSLLASAGGDGIVRIWDIETGRSLLALTAHTRRARSVLFSVDGTRLYSGGDDKTIGIYGIPR